MKGKVRTEEGILFEVNIDAERFSKSVHGGLGCISCHINYKENPHQPPKDVTIKVVSELADSIAHKAMVDPVAYASCVQCHKDAYKKVKDSIHGKNVFEKKQKDGALCLDCHGSPHYIQRSTSRESMVNKWNIVYTCAECHEREDIIKKYNLGTQILKSYKESFHGKKHILGHPDAPTCVDCHGSHNIRKWDDPLSLMSWENRIGTCGKCHPGANRKFVTAITHKPVGKDNPIPYYGEKLLIILTISVIAFTVGHVILEAYAEIRDRVFRKGREESNE